MIFNYPEKLEYIYQLYDFVNNCYIYRKKYTVMPDGKIFFSYYKANKKISHHTFFAKPSDVKFLYFKIRFLLRHANTYLFPHNNCSSRIKLSYHLKNYEFAYQGLAFRIFGSKTPFSKMLINDIVMHKFIKKYCNKTLK